MPVRLDVYNWPETPGEQPPSMAAFTYTIVTLNASDAAGSAVRV